MEVERITPQLVNQTLRAWRMGQEAPPALLALDLLEPGSQSSTVARAIHLQDEVAAIVQRELNQQRAVEGLAPLAMDGATRDGRLREIAADFAPGNAELQAWSALHHRYLCRVPFNVEDLAQAIPVDPRHFRRRINLGIERLTAVLQRAELDAHQRQAAQRRHRHLPPPEYARLFGVAAVRDEIVAYLRDADGPSFLSIEGLGGIGKTALARAVALELARESDYEEIAWISARQTWLSEHGEIETTPDAVRSRDDLVGRLVLQLGLEHLAGRATVDKLTWLAPYLGRRPHLIVIDNLESITDVEALLPALTPLAGVTRFLMTSRQALGRYPYVHRRPLPPLSPADSQALFEAELERHGHGRQLSPAEQEQLYAIIGGLPLALKLVAAQAGHWALPAILREMAAASAGAPEALYSFIYRRAWLALDDAARTLLLAMLTISPDGEDMAWLRLVSGLDQVSFDGAVRQLLAYNLLEQQGAQEKPLFRLHRLTVTFLQTEIVNDWLTPPGDCIAPDAGEPDEGWDRS